MHSEMPNLRFMASNDLVVLYRGMAGAYRSKLASEDRTIAANTGWFTRDQHGSSTVDPMRFRLDKIVIHKPGVNHFFFAAFRHKVVPTPVGSGVRDLSKNWFGRNGSS